MVKQPAWYDLRPEAMLWGHEHGRIRMEHTANVGQVAQSELSSLPLQRRL
jgi:chlorite dismutase